MISDTISILTDSTLVETANLIANDTLIIKIQHCSTSSAEQSTILEYVLKNGITILIALVAGLLALIQVKSNVIATARIKWMDELRICISELCNVSLKTSLDYKNYKRTEKDDQRDFYSHYVLSYSKFKTLSNKIYLLLDSTNVIHSQIEKLINKIDALISDPNINTTKQEDITPILSQILELSKQIFKQEWKRSKKVFKL